MYNRALVATDGSDNAWRAINKVIDLAKGGAIGEVVVFYSISHKMLSEGESEQLFMSAEEREEILEKLRVAGNLLLQKTAAAFEAENIFVEVRLITDKFPEEYIIEEAYGDLFDLVVLGSTGAHSKIREVFLGSVPTRVLHKVKCDVLVIR
jgi:nucleotide-binding universal stress UspA family protein